MTTTTECEEENSEELSQSKIAEKIKNWNKQRQEAKVIPTEDYQDRFKILLSEIIILKLKNPTLENLVKIKEPSRQSLDVIKYQNKLSKAYASLIYILKGIAYDESLSKLQNVMDSNPDGVDHLFTTLEIFLESSHKELNQYVVENQQKVPKKLFKKITFLDEEIFRFLSILSQYYTQQELEGKIRNWQYFEGILKAEMEQNKKTLKGSYAMKYFHNQAERQKFEKDHSYKPSYFEG